jgi:signal transduction histidine kinase
MNTMTGFFGALVHPDTFKRMAYLLLGLPLGVFYLVFLVTAILLGAGLVIIWVGLPILFGTMVAWRAMGRFERRLLTMIGAEIEEPAALDPQPGWREQAKAMRADSFTYRSFFWLLLRFPFGVIGAAIVGFGVIVPFAMVVSPLALAVPNSFEFGVGGASWSVGWNISWVVWLLPIVGILLAGLAAHVIQGFSTVHVMAGKALLGPSARDEVARERKRADVAEERTRLAHELHDSVGHTLTMMVVQAGAGGHVHQRDPEFAKQALENIEERGRTALGELDRILGILREDDGAQRSSRPGLSRVPVLVEELASAGLQIELRLEGQTDDLPGETSRSAYRIVQEALTNVLKHSGDVPAIVTIHRGAGAVEVEVLNEPPPNGTTGTMNGEGGGRGLIGIEERVPMLGGSVEYGPRPRAGFRVWARLPLDGAGV